MTDLQLFAVGTPHPETGHYATSSYGGGPYEAERFAYGAHDQWVERGHCRVVSGRGAWCHLTPAHDPAVLRHSSVLFTDGEFRPVWWDR